MLRALKQFFSKLKRFDYTKELKCATELQLQGDLELAYEKYQRLYRELKRRKLDAELAIVINNLISLEYKLGRLSKYLYEELLVLRFKLFLKDEERYVKDYIYTLLMGVDWFGKPKEKNLKQVKMLLEINKSSDFYSDVVAIVKRLEA